MRSTGPGTVQRSLIGAIGLAALLMACSNGLAMPGIGGSIPRCADIPRIEAAPGLYRDAPIYVANEMPVEDVQAWASWKPGFVDLWIDREHLGWITVAFNGDVSARQAELGHEFPGVGVVAVSVPWTKAELEALQQRVIKAALPLVSGSGIRANYGVVSIYVPYLKPEVVAQLNAKFGGLRVCLEGGDPADAPEEGPQQSSGDGWRLIADQDHVGDPYRTGIAADADALAALWAQIGLTGALPAVDFETEVVVWFGAVHGSSCPRLRLDDVVVDGAPPILHSVITSFEAGVCTSDAIGHAYVVAVQRAKLPHGPFVIQLQAEEPPAGVVGQEKTIVDADLSVPGWP